MTLRSLLGIGLFFGTMCLAQAQDQTWAASASLALPSTYGIQGTESVVAESAEDFLPYAEPILGIEKSEYEAHFSEYRAGSLMDRVLDLEHMELQAIYADSKMHEINVSFNSSVKQDLVVNVYDQFGQKVMSELHTVDHGINNYKIGTEDLQDGFYSLVVIGNKDQFIQRFIIE